LFRTEHEGRPEAATRMFETVKHLFRLLRTARTLARHDALFFLEDAGVAPVAVRLLKSISSVRSAGRPGERLARALMALGPSFIKLGQSLAVRSDLIGDSVAADLSALQARMPPFPGATAIATVEHELGGPLDTYFEEFDATPVAAASIAQVHFARTTEGEAVAVKVLRPGIEADFRRDVAFLLWIARAVEAFAPASRRLRPVAAVEAFRGWVADELDLRMEAAAASEFAEIFANDPEFHVPNVDWARTARRVLTLERVEGIPIDDIEQLAAAGLDGTVVLERSAGIFFRQVFEHGFFHADMHPGNMFVGADGTLLPVDFGIMGRLDRRTRHYLADMLVGFLTGDYRRVADVHFDAGYVPRHQSRAAFMQACRAIGEPIIGRPMNEISLARLLAQLFEVTERFEMEAQPQLLLLQKTMLVAEGVGRRLDPDSNMWVVTRPLVEAWMIENRGPQAQFRDAAERMAETVRRIPELADGLSAMATADGLRLHPDTVAAMKAPASGGSRFRWPWLLAAALGGLLIGLLF
jgi:ubiquinone biosynthesis protein